MATKRCFFLIFEGIQTAYSYQRCIHDIEIEPTESAGTDLIKRNQELLTGEQKINREAGREL